MPGARKVHGSLQQRAGLVPIWRYVFAGDFLLLKFVPTTLWSLRASEVTSSGGKVLNCPTPYSVKLALVDAAIQGGGNVEEARRLFELLKGRPLRIRPPADAVVSGTRVKIRKMERPESAGSGPVRMFDPTMAYREYVHFAGVGERGEFSVAISSGGLTVDERAALARAARMVTYSGKRGGFLRFVPADTADGLEEARLEATDPYSIPLSQARDGLLLGLIQNLDDLPCTAEWDRVSTFSDQRIRVVREQAWDGKADRVLVPTSVPYRLARSSRRFNYYRRSDLFTI